LPTVTDWIAKSPKISDAALRERLDDVVARAHALTGTAGKGPAVAPREIDAALSVLDALTELVRERLGDTAQDTAEITDLIVELRDVHGDIREHRVRRRSDSLVRIQRGLARLRGIGSVDDMIARCPAEVAQALGFDRVIISRVEDSMWIPVKIHVEGDAKWADEILAAASVPQPLDHMILESEMARRRQPMLVLDVQDREQVHRPIATVSDSRSYVAAPIMPEGRVIGFLHADYYIQQRHPEETDRDLLFAFAEGFGYAFERTVLAERLAAQGRQVRSMTASLEAVIEEIREGEVRLAGSADPTPEGRAAPVQSAGGAAEHRLTSLLTAREREVLALLAAGETNASIGVRLVISEGTVKTHVKHILRKLRAANRAEAVSKYLRLSQRAGEAA
jgi:DNA-binding CsgD family transcriptional regulator